MKKPARKMRRNGRNSPNALHVKRDEAPVPKYIDFLPKNITSTFEQKGRILPDDLYRWRNDAFKRVVDIWQADKGRDIEELRNAVWLFLFLLDAKVTSELASGFFCKTWLRRRRYTRQRRTLPCLSRVTPASQRERVAL